MLRLICRSTLYVRLYDGLLKTTTLNNFNNFQSNLYNNLTKRPTNSNRIVLNFCTTAQNVDDVNKELNIEEIVGGDAELEHKLKVLFLETEVWRQEGKPIPNNSSLKTLHWQELLRLPSKSARRKYLEFLFKIEKKHENRARKKEEKRIEREQNPRPAKEFSVQNYELGQNSIFLRFRDTTINHLYNSRLIQAMMFGQKLAVDCGYYNNMTTRENINCAKQLMFLFAENRISDEPFDLHFCNVNNDSSLMKSLHKSIATLYEPAFPLHLHKQSYLDIFPNKEQLVYLTPHCRDVLKEYDHDAIYIIGAIVDKVNNEPLSLAKAKKEGLRMAKLPLDYYLEWGSGSGKSLTLNQMISILCDIKKTGDWKYALRHVPRRKLSDFQREVAVDKFNLALGNIRAKTETNPKFNRKFAYSPVSRETKIKPNKSENVKKFMK